MTDPELLPLRVAERYGRLFMWTQGLELAPRERAVLDHLIAAGDKNLSSWWSHAKIGEAKGLSEKSVQRAMAELEKAGLIHRRKQVRKSGRNPDHVTVLAPPELSRLRDSLADMAARLDPNTLVGVEVDPSEYRLGMRQDKLTGRMDSRQDKLTDKPSDLREEYMEREEGSAVNLTGPTRRHRSAGPRAVADVVADLRGAA